MAAATLGFVTIPQTPKEMQKQILERAYWVLSQNPFSHDTEIGAGAVRSMLSAAYNAGLAHSRGQFMVNFEWGGIAPEVSVTSQQHTSFTPLTYTPSHRTKTQHWLRSTHELVMPSQLPLLWSPTSLPASRRLPRLWPTTWRCAPSVQPPARQAWRLCSTCAGPSWAPRCRLLPPADPVRVPCWLRALALALAQAEEHPCRQPWIAFAVRAQVL